MADTGCDRTRSRVANRFPGGNGAWPVRQAYRTAPSPYTSIRGVESSPVKAACSGDEYSGVPTNTPATVFRNTFLEDLHAGTTPSSKTGDYSDVKVVTPYGEIPWSKLSRLSDTEMKRLMMEIVNKVYTFLRRQNDPEFLTAFLNRGGLYTARWDEPGLEADFIIPAKLRRHPDERA
jgi:hypothetical protein